MIYTSNEDKKYLSAMSKLNQTLRNTVVTVEHQGVKVTVTAEPKIVSIDIPQKSNPDILAKALTECINMAFSKSLQVMLQNASKELQKRT